MIIIDSLYEYFNMWERTSFESLQKFYDGVVQLYMVEYLCFLTSTYTQILYVDKENKYGFLECLVVSTKHIGMRGIANWIERKIEDGWSWVSNNGTISSGFTGSIVLAYILWYTRFEQIFKLVLRIITVWWEVSWNNTQVFILC